MQTIVANLLDCEKGYMVHQVNCRGVMGGGVAKQVKDKWVHLYAQYNEKCRRHAPQPARLLGSIQTFEIRTNLWLVNLFGQEDYGRDKKYTDYNALLAGLLHTRLHRDNLNPELTIYIPYGIGCGLGGGNWKEVEALIEFAIPDAVLCKLEGKEYRP